MGNSSEYKKAIEQAKANLEDLRERGADAIGESWEEVRHKLFTLEELAASDIRVGLMLEISRAQ